MASDPHSTSHFTRSAASVGSRMDVEPAITAELGEIDASSKVPVLFFAAAGVLWLLVATVLDFIASSKLHSPGFLAECEWLTYGRVQPAAINAALYGWGVNAAFAVAIWLLTRLSRSAIRFPGLLVVAGLFWNVGVKLGVCGILLGHSTSIEWLEIPSSVSPLLFAAFALIGTWAYLTFRFGREENIFISQWYVVGALFWFAWSYSVGQIMAVFAPARGTVQSIVTTWYGHNFMALWFTPIALAGIYYFLSKLLGKTIQHYTMAPLGFWTLAFVSGFAGLHHLIGAPVPAWVQTTGVSASYFMIVPVVIISVNIFSTLSGSWGVVRQSVSLPFIVFGSVCFTLGGAVGIIGSIPSVSEVLHFTYFTSGYTYHTWYAFFSMVMFGSLYYMVPRLLDRAWPSASLIKVHFWTSAIGIAGVVLSLFVCGIVQGGLLNELDGSGTAAPFLQIIEATQPYLLVKTGAVVLLAIGHIAFAVNLIRILLQRRSVVTQTRPLYSRSSTAEASR